MRGRIAKKIYKRLRDYEYLWVPHDIMEGDVAPKKVLGYTKSQYCNARHIFLKQFTQWLLCDEIFLEFIEKDLSSSTLVLNNMAKRCQEKYHWTRRKAIANLANWNCHRIFRNRRNKDYRDEPT